MFRRLLCLFGYHHYLLKEKINNSVYLIECVNCRNEFLVNDRVKTVVNFDAEMKEFYNH